MGDMKSELAKIGKYAGAANSCDARPAKDKSDKVTNKARKTTEPVAIRALYDAHGAKYTADVLCITVSGLQTILNRDTTSASLEKLAITLAKLEGTPIKPPSRLLVCRVSVDQCEAFRTLCTAMQIKAWDFANDGY